MIIALIALIILKELGVINSIKSELHKVFVKFKRYPLQMTLRFICYLLLCALAYVFIVTTIALLSWFK